MSLTLCSLQASFFRVKQTADPLDMIESMTKAGFNPPRLILSVTGGAMDFELSKELETVIKRGLRKVCTTLPLTPLTEV